MEGKVRKKEEKRPENEVFATRLKELRVKKYKSRSAFSKALNGEDFNDVNSIYRWETGTRVPPFPVLRKIATLLETSVSYLVGEIDYPGPLTPSVIEASKQKNIADFDAVPKIAVIDIPVMRESDFKKLENGKIELSVESYFPIAKEFVEPFARECGMDNLRIIVMNGDAMSPRFKDGDYLLFAHADTAREPDVIVAVYKSKVVVRGYFSGEGGTILKSLNMEYYPDIKADASDLFIQGVIKARIPFPVRDNGFY